MRSALFTLSYPVLEYKGGLYFGAIAHQRAVSYCRDYVDVIWVVARRRRAQQIDPHLAPLASINAQLVVELPDFGAASSHGFRAFCQLLADQGLKASLTKVFREADFLYADGMSIESYVAAATARSLGKTVFLELRGEALIDGRYLLSRFGVKGICYAAVFRLMLRGVLKQSSAVLYLNRGSAERHRAGGALSEVISDVELPADLEPLPRQLTQPARHYLYVGALEKVKRLDLILSALSRAGSELPDDWTLSIVGDGPEYELLNRHVAAIGIRKHVEFVGPIWRKDRLFEFYRSSDLLLLASLSETGPRVLVEAMACGLPVLSSAVGLASELLDPEMLVKGWGLGAWAGRLALVVNDCHLLNRVSFRNIQRSEPFAARLIQARRQMFYSRALEKALVYRGRMNPT